MKLRRLKRAAAQRPRAAHGAAHAVRAAASSDAAPDCQASDVTIAQLVAQVYEAAPAAERGHLLEQLLRPLGVLSLFAVADGVFAKIRLRSGWQALDVRLEDIESVRAGQVAALVDHVQQVSVEALDGLGRWVAASPVLAGSAAAVVLAAVLLRRGAQRSLPWRDATRAGSLRLEPPEEPWSDRAE